MLHPAGPRRRKSALPHPPLHPPTNTPRTHQPRLINHHHHHNPPTNPHPPPPHPPPPNHLPPPPNPQRLPRLPRPRPRRHPSTPTGYLRICLLRLVTIRDPFHPPSIPASLIPKTGFLSSKSTTTPLPYRPGPRPTVAGIAPQRQTTQKSSSTMYTTLCSSIQDLVSHHPQILYEGTSCFEKHSTGVFCTGPTPTLPHTQTAPTSKEIDISSLIFTRHRLTCNGEVCHAHPSDGSLHLTLHPADVKLVIERGWGQRHPLTRESWWWCYLRTVPTGFVMVYAPRNRGELDTVLEIIRAAAWWVSGVELGRGNGEKGDGGKKEGGGGAVYRGGGGRIVGCEL
ncbi:hypothetical protein BO94DRAFT_559991 [Aspergillus sclerotioniger CBS 115572]|uniref:Luciferase domain-containing protein n=1 Tax=Aspergillus sclerotioniger CBS 115572 TaxID=1450535 RepID=A0A317VJ02_9EURO|nr:hypothetical protein BO94DRAFT_559991 [Aspergillus sclerotioniger CBS 115572]PWY73211.1 hypothetical protein BO94DRAFT_559991 [Aspergillus sclerotioniger CBS 115572]